MLEISADRREERVTGDAPGWLENIMLRRLAAWSGPALRLELPDGSCRLVGRAEDGVAAPRVTIRDWRFFRRALHSGDIGVGESFVAGEWDTPDLPALVRVFLRDRRALDERSAWSWLADGAHQLRRVLESNTRAGSRRNIRHHYDLSNELFASFLDETMTYSCGLFEKPGATLHEAQLAKIDAACRRLGLAPGMQLLEIGSGWGALARHAAREYGCEVTSITLSEEQLRLARERAEAAGLGHRIRFELCDYRDVAGSYDRIVSIEMLEAVGAEYYGAFFRRCDELLRPGGRIFLQTITVPDARFDSYRRGYDWIRKYIYPGGCLASQSAIVAALQRETSLRIEWLCEIGPHYERTLKLWRERFLASRGELRQLGFDTRFLRMWEFYLASCEAAFANGYTGNLQLLLGRAHEMPRIEA